jgi:hypothetical protein
MRGSSPRMTSEFVGLSDSNFQTTRKFSPRRLRPSCAWSHPRRNRGRREDRVRAAPAVSCANAHKENAHEHTGSAEAIRPSLRSGFTTYFVLSSVTGLSCHRHSADISAKLDTSVGVSGPHDFAVRVSAVRLATLPRPPHPAPTLVTMANAPLSEDGMDVI